MYALVYPHCDIFMGILDLPPNIVPHNQSLTICHKFMVHLDLHVLNLFNILESKGATTYLHREKKRFKITPFEQENKLPNNLVQQLHNQYLIPNDC